MRGRSQITSALSCAFQSLQSGGLSGWRKQSPFFKKQDFKQWINLIQRKPEDLPNLGGLQYLVITFTLNWMVSFLFLLPCKFQRHVHHIWKLAAPAQTLGHHYSSYYFQQLPTGCMLCQFQFHTYASSTGLLWRKIFCLEPMSLESLLPQNNQLLMAIWSGQRNALQKMQAMWQLHEKEPGSSVASGHWMHKALPLRVEEGSVSRTGSGSPMLAQWPIYPSGIPIHPADLVQNKYADQPGWPTVFLGNTRWTQTFFPWNEDKFSTL